MDTFSQTTVTPNTKGENKNTILTSEKENKFDALTETLKGLKIKRMYIMNQNQQTLISKRAILQAIER